STAEGNRAGTAHGHALVLTNHVTGECERVLAGINSQVVCVEQVHTGQRKTVVSGFREIALSSYSSSRRTGSRSKLERAAVRRDIDSAVAIQSNCRGCP